MSDIKHIIRQEYLKCCQDPVYFMRKYCYIQHPQRGRIQFNLYPFQEKVLTLLQNNDYSAILKSRQLGISTLVSGYGLWLMNFHKDKNILALATTQATARNLVSKVQFMWDNLPSWLKVDAVENNKLSLRLTNGSKIQAKSSNADAARSEAVSLLIIDEAAFIDNIAETWASAQQTLATGGGAIVLSTPYGTGNWFHQTWVKAESGENDFLPIKLPWYVHPERNQTWRDAQDNLLGDPRLAAQECFSKDTIIYTKFGPQYIKNIKLGDLVLSHDGSYNKVIKKHSHITDKSIEIKGGLNNIQKYTTLNHPFLNMLGEWEDVGSIIDSNNKVKYFPKVDEYKVECKTIDLSNYIISNSPKSFPLKIDDKFIWLTKTSKINRFIKIDYDLGFLIGCFLSEGSLAKNKVEFSFNGKTEREGFPLEIERILTEKFNITNFSYYTSKIWEGSSKLYIKDQIFHNFIKLCIQGGKYSYNKHISEFLYSTSNEETLKGILDGVLVGDGMLKSEYNVQLLLTSEKLIYDMLYISNILGIHNVTLKKGKSQNPNNPDKDSWRDNFTLTWTNSIINSDEKIFSKRIKDWSRINTIGKSNSNSNFEFISEPLTSLKLTPSSRTLEVFNLEIENTHTYVTEYGIVHNCDCDFSTSGDIVFYSEHLEYYEKSFIKDPLERRGVDQNLWVWENADYSRSYMVLADVARGDGKDFSTCHVMDIENNVQVAEYKGQIGTKEFGHLLVGLATEYNEALLVIENANIGWATIQVAIDRNYSNLYYSQRSGETNADSYFDQYQDNSKLVAGFTMSSKTRPMVIGKFQEYINDKGVTIQSKRLIEEMKVFIWKNGRAEAQGGYNDDLVMAFGMGMYVRDTALKFKQRGIDLTKQSLNNMTVNRTPYHGGYGSGYGQQVANPYSMKNDKGGIEDITWLL
jgi:hypothetical protein